MVLITGASEGIGAACAAAFRKRGARLSLLARSGRKVARRRRAPSALITAGDVTVPEVREAAVAATIDRFGGIDILINNAGMGLYDPAWSAPLADARSLFELNFFAPLALTQLVAPHMRARASGVVVNVSSVAGKVTLPWLTLYSASKYALGSLTDGLRMELKKDGIHTITVCPGYVKTSFQDHALGGGPPPEIARQETIRDHARAMRRSDRARGGARRAHRDGAAIRLAVCAGRAAFPFPGGRATRRHFARRMILKLKRTPGIYLVGFMGSGKSTIGRLLADRIGWHFVDLDAEIEAAEQTSILEIFETRGEAEFRRFEREKMRAARARHRMRPAYGDGVGRRGDRTAREFRAARKQRRSPSGWIVLSRPSGGAWSRPRTGRWRAIPRVLRKLYEARRDSYARADYRIPIESDDPAVTVEAVLKLPLFK